MNKRSHPFKCYLDKQRVGHPPFFNHRSLTFSASLLENLLALLATYWTITGHFTHALQNEALSNTLTSRLNQSISQTLSVEYYFKDYLT